MLTKHTNTYTHTNTRSTEAYLYYKRTYEPKGSGELKIIDKTCTLSTIGPAVSSFAFRETVAPNRTLNQYSNEGNRLVY